MNPLSKKKSKKKENVVTKQPIINYNDNLETDTFDFYEDEEPYKEIQIT